MNCAWRLEWRIFKSHSVTIRLQSNNRGRPQEFFLGGRKNILGRHLYWMPWCPSVPKVRRNPVQQPLEESSRGDRASVFLLNESLNLFLYLAFNRKFRVDFRLQFKYLLVSGARVESRLSNGLSFSNMSFSTNDWWNVIAMAPVSNTHGINPFTYSGGPPLKNWFFYLITFDILIKA